MTVSQNIINQSGNQPFFLTLSATYLSHSNYPYPQLLSLHSPSLPLSNLINHETLTKLLVYSVRFAHFRNPLGGGEVYCAWKAEGEGNWASRFTFLS